VAELMGKLFLILLLAIANAVVVYGFINKGKVCIVSGTVFS
jgi:hypothetical protein